MSEDDVDREAILRRRRRLVNLALAGLASATMAGCNGGEERVPPEPCLSCAIDECGPFDAGTDAGDASGEDSGTIVIRDAGSEDDGGETDAASADDGG